MNEELETQEEQSTDKQRESSSGQISRRSFVRSLGAIGAGSAFLSCSGDKQAKVQNGSSPVDGLPAELGRQVDGSEKICLDGRPLPVEKTTHQVPRVIAYHKPVGELVTRDDPEGRPTVFAALPGIQAGRWVPVGRLDINTAGLLLLTTDGTLAHRLMHPSGGVEREYAVRVLGEVDDDQRRRLTTGIELDDGPASFEQVVPAGGEGANRWYHVVLREGRKREVRRLWEALGHTVSRLIRVRYGPVRLGRELRPGKWRELTGREFAALYREAGLEAPGRPTESGRNRSRPGAPRRGTGRSRGRR